MIVRLSRWSALALTSALALSACAGNAGPTTPSAPSFSRSAPAAPANAWGAHIATASVPMTATCPKKFYACITIYKTGKAELRWCYGPASDPCGDSNAGKAKWSGVVCLAAGAGCKAPIKQLTAKWSGPFKCKTSDDCNGTYELDTLTPHSGIKVSSKYIYKQNVHICPKADACDIYNVGIAVKS
jgi:hypothetical protein